MSAADGSLVDPVFFDLFRQEMETQTTVLNDGLLSLEGAGGAVQELEALMRAAHSIKGAARIVQCDPAVRLAHVMEDCFVAAQAGRLQLKSAHIDVLLRGVDMLQRIARIGKWQAAAAIDPAEVAPLVSELSQVLSGGPTMTLLSPVGRGAGGEGAALAKPEVVVGQPPNPTAELPTAQPPATAPAPQPEPSPASQTSPAPEPVRTAETTGPAIRVTAQTLDRLMGLAGECLVEVGWLRSFADSLQRIKGNYGKLAKLLERVQEAEKSGAPAKDLSALLAEAGQKTVEGRGLLGDSLPQFEMFSRRLESLAERLCGEMVASRMRPFADGVGAFPRMVRDLARSLGKKVKLEILGKATLVDRDILERLEAPLNHLLRNAVDHGIEQADQRRAANKPEEGTVRLEARHLAGMLSITVSDDGRGVDLEGLRKIIVEKNLATAEMVARMTESELVDFLFLPGFSTAKQLTEVSGRGVGLDVVQSMVQNVGGSLRAVTRPGAGVVFQLQLPITLSVLRTLLVQIGGQSYAIPLARIDRLLMLPRDQWEVLDGCRYCMVDGQAVGLVASAQIFGDAETAAAEITVHGDCPDVRGQHTPGLSEQCSAGRKNGTVPLVRERLPTEVLPVVVLSDRFGHYGLVVERFLGERDLVVRPLDPRLGKVKDIAATAVAEDGSIMLIVDVEDLIGSIDNRLASGQRCNPVADARQAAERRRKRVLVVDDSLTVREVERKLLENHGYEVATAVDGLDGWSAVLAGNFDLVISDYDMPRLNGVELVSRIRAEPRLQSLPVMLVSYKDREEDKRRGLEAGANYYLAKSGFHDELLLGAVVDLIGEPDA